MEAFAALGMHQTVPGHVMSTLESFVCAMYARPKMGSVNKARYIRKCQDVMIYLNVHMPPKSQLQIPNNK